MDPREEQLLANLQSAEVALTKLEQAEDAARASGDTERVALLAADRSKLEAEVLAHRQALQAYQPAVVAPTERVVEEVPARAVVEEEIYPEEHSNAPWVIIAIVAALLLLGFVLYAANNDDDDNTGSDNKTPTTDTRADTPPRDTTPDPKPEPDPKPPVDPDKPTDTPETGTVPETTPTPTPTPETPDPAPETEPQFSKSDFLVLPNGATEVSSDANNIAGTTMDSAQAILDFYSNKAEGFARTTVVDDDMVQEYRFTNKNEEFEVNLKIEKTQTDDGQTAFAVSTIDR